MHIHFMKKDKNAKKFAYKSGREANKYLPPNSWKRGNVSPLDPPNLLFYAYMHDSDIHVDRIQDIANLVLSKNTDHLSI